jgi:hypothetical protein
MRLLEQVRSLSSASLCRIRRLPRNILYGAEIPCRWPLVADQKKDNKAPDKEYGGNSAGHKPASVAHSIFPDIDWLVHPCCLSKCAAISKFVFAES